MMGTQEQFHKLHLNRSKRLYKYTFQLFRMIHENSISPESAIQGTGSLARRYRRGASWKDTTQHGQGERRVENADKIILCFSLCAFWSHQRIHFHIKLLCSSQQELPAPGPADLYRSPGSRSSWQGSSARAAPHGAELLTPAGC